MTHNKNIKNYEEINKKLHKLGISSVRQKKNYSTNEKRQISRVYNHFHQEADWAAKPEKVLSGDAVTYSTRELKTRKEIKLARSAGQVVYKNKIIIKHYVNEKVRLKRATTLFSKGEKVLQIERVKGRVRRDVQIAETFDILKFLENQGDVRTPPGIQITVAIGGPDRPFNTRDSITTSYNDLLNYISNWEPKDAVTLNKDGSSRMTKEQGEKLRLELIGQMTVVTIKSLKRK